MLFTIFFISLLLLLINFDKKKHCPVYYIIDYENESWIMNQWTFKEIRAFRAFSDFDRHLGHSAIFSLSGQQHYEFSLLSLQFTTLKSLLTQRATQTRLIRRKITWINGHVWVYCLFLFIKMSSDNVTSSKSFKKTEENKYVQCCHIPSSNIWLFQYRHICVPKDTICERLTDSGECRNLKAKFSRANLEYVAA